MLDISSKPKNKITLIVCLIIRIICAKRYRVYLHKTNKESKLNIKSNNSLLKEKECLYLNSLF